MSDLIDRQAAIDAFNTNLNELVVGGEENAKTVENYLNRVLDKIKCLPSALGTNLAGVGTDCISRQAAIDLLKQMRKDGDMVPWEGKDVFARIRKLPAQPEKRTDKCTETHACDCISRQEATDALDDAEDAFGYLTRDWREVLMELPSAQPKRGKWIEDKGQQILMQNFIERGEVWRVCSICGAGHMIGHKYAIDKAYHDRHHNYCPNCGADMRGEQNAER